MEKKTFYDWCKEKQHEDWLERWDYSKNSFSPKDIGSYSNKYCYFICPKCGKSTPHQPNNIVTKDQMPKCTYCNSFGVWCIEHERRDLLKRWDYEKNKVSPFDVQKTATGKKYYFKCPRGIHPSEAKRLDHVVDSFVSSQCEECKSFGQWGIDTFGKDFLKKYWSDKNSRDPMKIRRQSSEKVWIKCPDVKYHQDYQVTCNNFFRGCRCPYCAGVKTDIHDSLGCLYPESFNFWFQKKDSPYDYLPGAEKQVYWKCEKHGLYRQRIHDAVRAEFTCPKCNAETSESSYERKVRLYLEKIFGKDDVLHESKCNLRPKNPQTNARLRYDNEVVSIKLII